MLAGLDFDDIDLQWIRLMLAVDPLTTIAEVSCDNVLFAAECVRRAQQ